MSKYTDPTDNFKLIQASDSHAFTKRNMKIWDMILNRLGLPDHLHEPVRAIYVSGNWDEVNGMEEITTMRMARNLTSNQSDLQRIYNRLKKSIPRLFEWQDNQPFIIIEREIINEKTDRYKTKARYNFLLYDIVFKLFNLPKEMSLTAVRVAVDKTLKDYPRVDKPSRKPKKRKLKSAVLAYIHNASEVIDLAGSIELAAVEIDEENSSNIENEKVTDLAKALLILKDL